jgi:hypothetical protein
MDLGVREVILAEELEHGLRHLDGCNMLVELDETRAQVHGITDGRATEAGRLSRCLIWVAGVLINLGMSPIEDIP